MFVSAIVLAAGQGKRMNSNINKQFLSIREKPILVYTLEVFVKHPLINEIIIVAQTTEIEWMKKNIIKGYFKDTVKSVKITNGGLERYDSVNLGLNCVEEISDYIIIHDGARPLVSEKEITDSINCLKTEKACVLGVKAKNTIKLVDDNNYVSASLQRTNLYSIITPQSFHKEIIMGAYTKGMHNPVGITDDGMMVERYTDCKVKVIEGSYENIKITTHEDLGTMEHILDYRLKLQ